MNKWLLTFITLTVIFSLSTTTVFAQTNLLISNVTDNKTDYNGGQIPKHEKLEITFQITGSVSSNYQLPFLSSSEASDYLQKLANVGISVDALFLPPGRSNWQNAYRQPGFYYQHFNTSSDPNYLYPLDQYSWRVRFSPNQIGTWRYKIVAKDAGGQAESQEFSFDVVFSSNPGFIRISKTDTRYFEFEDGNRFQGIGISGVALSRLYDNTYLKNLKDNNIQFIRPWVAPFNIHGTTWTAWQMMPGSYDGYLPRVPIIPMQNVAGQPLEFKYYLAEGSSWYQACIFLGHTQQSPALKRNTDYHVRVKYKGANITGPRDSNYPDYGLVVKVGGWAGSRCKDPYKPSDPTHTKTDPITTYGTSSNWSEVRGVWNSGNRDYMPYFYMVLENANTDSRVYIESIDVYEMSGGTVNNPTLTGPQILDKYSPNEHLYFAQRPSYKLDLILDKIKTNNIYIRPVVNEKQEYLFAKLDEYGNPTFEDNFNRFYGSGRNVYYVRFIQQAWWRYVQARWGYSTNIHSWELLNEGNPANTDHFAIADELGIFMKCKVFGVSIPQQDGVKCDYNHPNHHPVTTSFWHSFPATSFWKNTNYPNVDYANVHSYISTSNSISCQEKYDMQYDSAYYHQLHSLRYHGWNVGKPITRGEAGMDGFVEESGGNCTIIDRDGATRVGRFRQNSSNLGIAADTQGIWLHKYVWAHNYHGSLHDFYWWVNNHNVVGPINNLDKYKNYYNFIKNIPLNNGSYQDANASVDGANLRAWGQKDLVLGRAHFWIDNSKHTWKNVVDGVSIPPVTGTVTVGGFKPSTSYKIEWWDTYTGTISSTQNVVSSSNGDIVLSISNLSTDTAVKIGSYDTTLSPTQTLSPTLAPIPGDANGDGKVDGLDYVIWLNNYGTATTEGASKGDFNADGRVDGLDYVIWLNNYGTQSPLNLIILTN